MIESWFPTLILCEDLSNKFETQFNSNVYAIAKDLQKTYNNETEWSCDTFNTMGFDLKNEKFFDDFLNDVKCNVYKLADSYKIHKKHKLVVEDLWINIAPPGEYQEYHNHFNTKNYFSAVYYVKTPENCGNIVLRTQESWSDIIDAELEISERDNISSSTCFYTPCPSLLLVFRSSLLHMVQKNKSNEDRVSIAMNFSFE